MFLNMKNMGYEAFMYKKLILSLVILFISNCTHTAINSESNLPTEAETESESNVDSELYLKLEDMEMKLKEQQGRVRLLESALNKQEKQENGLREKTQKKRKIQDQNDLILSDARKAGLRKSKDIEVKKSKEGSLELYKAHMALAVEQFEKKKLNKAYLSFSAINREYSIDVSKGEPLYWMGRCWFELKEYQSANALFKQFLNLLPERSLSESAEIYSAKADFFLGNTADARRTLNRLLTRTPSSPNTTLAKELLNSKQSHAEGNSL